MIIKLHKCLSGLSHLGETYLIDVLGFGTASVLFPTLITFCLVKCVFGIAIKWFVNVTNFVRISLFEK